MNDQEYDHGEDKNKSEIHQFFHTKNRDKIVAMNLRRRMKSIFTRMVTQRLDGHDKEISESSREN